MDKIFSQVTPEEWQDEGADTDIPSGEWRRGTGDFTTEGFSSCAVVIAHNSQTHEGLVGHFAKVTADPPGEHYEEFEEMLGQLGDIGPSEATEVWIGGGGIHFASGGIPGGEENRQFIETELRNAAEHAGIPESALQFSWLEEDAHVVATLHAQTGALVVQTLPELPA